MFGPSLTSIFRSRWMALIWAAMVIWFAVDVAGSTPNPSANRSIAATADATGAPVANEDVAALRRFAQGH